MKAEAAKSAEKIDDIATLVASLISQGVPSDLHPPTLPKGRLSYTMKSFNGAALEVHHIHQFYYIKACAPDIPLPAAKNWSWSKGGGAAPCWDSVKSLIDPEWITLL